MGDEWNEGKISAVHIISKGLEAARRACRVRCFPVYEECPEGLPATRKRALIDQLFTALVWLAANTHEYY